MRIVASVALLLVAFVPFVSEQQSAPSAQPATAGSRVFVEYLGTAGWRISDGRTVILVDPYISRIIGPPPPLRPPYQRQPGDPRPIYKWSDPATPDEAAIDARIPRADFVLVTHTHYDHVLDVPHIALKTHAAVLGTESTQNVLRAYGVPEEQLFAVRGGEDYEFGKCSVRVIPSLHSPLDHKHYFSSDKAPAGLKSPLTLEQIHPEGGTLAYLIRLRGHHILVFGGMNYIERELEGLRPDVVMVGAAGSRSEIYDYTGRLLRVLHFPALVLPTHWDDFFAPFDASQQRSIDALQPFLQETHAVSPNSKVLIPKYFDPIFLDDAVRP